MKIQKERTRLIFTEFSPNDKSMIEKLVSTMDQVFTYEDTEKKAIYLPPGIVDSIRKTFPNIPIEDKSNEHWPAAKAAPEVEGHFEPRNDLQKDAINFALKHAESKHKVGFILGPGEGKTFMASYCAVKVGLKTLIIAPTTGTRDQWTESLITMLKIDPSNITTASNAKQFINAKTDYVVTMQSTLAQINRDYDLERILKDKKFGIKMIDECQMWFKNIIQVDGCSNIIHNWYLTGTFGRSSEAENTIYQEIFGEIELFETKFKPRTIFRQKPETVYGQRPHMNCDMYWMNCGLSEEQVQELARSTMYGVSIPKLTEVLIPSDGSETTYIKKVMKIIKRAEKITQYGTSLVLTPTINSVDVLAEHVKKAFPDKKIGTIHSKNKPENNKKAKAEADILISTVKSVGTGFDVKTLAKLIVLENFNSWILADQVSGRLRRRPDGKETYMHDVAICDFKQLRRWASKRADILKRKSKKFTVIDM